MLIVLLLVGVPTLLAALLGYFCTNSWAKAKEKQANTFAAGLVLFVIMTCVVGFFLLVFSLVSAGDARSLEAFYYDNANVYRETITETKNVLYMDLALVQQVQLASVENAQQSTNVSERVKEFRDKVVWHNGLLRSSRYFSQNIWTNWFVRAPSSELKPIQFTENP